MSGLKSGKVLVGFSLDLKISEGNNHLKHKYLSSNSFLYPEHQVEKSKSWKFKQHWMKCWNECKGEESHTGLNPEQRKKTVVISCLISVPLQTHMHLHTQTHPMCLILPVSTQKGLPEQAINHRLGMCTQKPVWKTQEAEELPYWISLLVHQVWYHCLQQWLNPDTSEEGNPQNLQST